MAVQLAATGGAGLATFLVRLPHPPPQFRFNVGNQIHRQPDERIITSKGKASLFFSTPALYVHHLSERSKIRETPEKSVKMAQPLDYDKICESCPPGDGWGPSVTSEITLDGVPYAPFSKGDKLGRMADWTTEGKDRERGGRLQYSRQYRGTVAFF